ncbi:hypothetical protein FF38_03216 [Lucilia cuprina]|uniref:Uncharacterized protein n=1 Tax=Lucilia cuprina TaxID=7375 RepID=A0A0L0BP16_LUCCU|nr:hypothetical protein FF38_03216 [Lucilia cuprina]
MNSMKTKPTVVPLTKHMNFILKSYNVSFNDYHVDYFRRVAANSNIYEFSIIREVPRFLMDISVKSLPKYKVVYKMSNMDGCSYLKNPIMIGIFSNIYKRILVNKTTFSCPIPKGVFFIRNEFWKNILPPLHPKGSFLFNVRIRNETSAKAALDFFWSYSIVNVKINKYPTAMNLVYLVLLDL